MSDRQKILPLKHHAVRTVVRPPNCTSWVVVLMTPMVVQPLSKVWLGRLTTTWLKLDKLFYGADVAMSCYTAMSTITEKVLTGTEPGYVVWENKMNFRGFSHKLLAPTLTPEYV